MADGPSAQSPDAAVALAEALRARLDVAELRAELGVLKSVAPMAPRRDATKLHLFQIQAVRDGLVIAVLLGILWLGYELSLVTVPMLLAMLLAYLFEPLVRRMVRTGIFSRPGAALLIIFSALLLVGVPLAIGVGTAVVQGVQVAGSVARTTNNLLTVRKFSDAVEEGGAKYGSVEPDPATESLVFSAAEGNEDAKKAAAHAAAAYASLPGQLREGYTKLYKHNRETAAREAAAQASPGAAPPQVVTKTPWWLSITDMGVAWVQNNTQAVAAEVGKGALGTGAGAVGAAVRTLQSVVHFGLTVVLTAFFFYFFSTGYGRVLSFWEGLIPERRKGRAMELIARMDRVIAGFVRGRLTICAILMLVYTAGYWAIGVPAPLVLGPIVGAFALIPFITILAMPLAIALMALEPSGVVWQQSWWWVLFAPVGMWMIERALDDYILTPAIQGKHTEMAVPAILFASLAGGVLAGVYGLLIAIPVAACLNILLKEVFWPRFSQWAQGRRKDFLPIEGDGL